LGKKGSVDAAVEFVNLDYQNKIIVPIGSINKASIQALRYAKTFCDDVVAFTVVFNDEQSRDIQEKFKKLHTTIPLVVKLSPDKKIAEPLLRYIESTEYDHESGDLVTVLLPGFVSDRWWHSILHGSTRKYIEKTLLSNDHIIVATIPFPLR
jgi:hypothetical protein